MRHCNSGPARGTRSAPARSSQAGHKKAGKKICCVTTRERLVLLGSAQDRRMCLLLDSGIPHGGVLFAPAGLPLAAAVRRGERVVFAAAWRPASGARGGGTRDPGNISGCSDLAGIGGCIPCAGRCGDAIGKDSRKNSPNRFREMYAGDVPREVLSPDGAAREARISLSGIFIGTSSLLAEDASSSIIIGRHRDSLLFPHLPLL
jgi:hypothetical protein